MPTNRSYIRRPHRRRLSHWQEMALWFGELPDRPVFRSEEEHRELWFHHRDRLMAWLAKGGRRPMAWWHFEVGDLRYPGYDRERSTLYAAGLLGEEEKAGLLTWWREQFEKTYEPHFFVCDGPGRIFEGAVARRKHFAWADIPQRLIDEWTKERQRRSQRIRSMKAAAKAPAA